jgi:hypothetical protein
MAEREDASEPRSLVSQILKEAEAVFREPMLHLEPEDSPFSPPAGRSWSSAYHITVARMLLEPIELETEREEHKEIASLVCLPSFAPEWALWVGGERKTGFSVLVSEAEERIWMLARTTESPFPARARTSQRPLPIDLAGAICDVWSRVLSQTRYAEESQVGNDGVYYHFGYWVVGKGPLAGKTWSPRGAMVPGKLVALRHNLKDYVQDPANQEVFLKVIEDHIEWFDAH